ncbi:hypothetical protein [Streptomyces sp. A3M-1-3]|nr:hypothetical protein [Streptomyces sp. A3M-1-3]
MSDEFEPEGDEIDPAEQAMHEDGFTSPRLWMPTQQDRRWSA